MYGLSVEEKNVIPVPDLFIQFIKSCKNGLFFRAKIWRSAKLAVYLQYK